MATIEVKVRDKNQAPAVAASTADAFPEMVGETLAMVDHAPEPAPKPVALDEPKKEEKKEKLSLNDLSVDQLRFLLEKKLEQEAKEAEAKAIVAAPPSKAPRGMLWVFNRAPSKFEFQYDGVIYEIEGHDMALYPEHIARHGRKRSILSIDPLANTAVFKLALEGEKKFGAPLTTVNRTELLDRKTSTNIMGRGAPVKTHVEVLPVAGVAELLSRREDVVPELE